MRMKPRHELLLVVLLIFLVDCTFAEEGKSSVLIYTSEMTGFADGIAETLMEDFGDECEFIVLDDPSLLSSLLSMPDVKCVVLPVFVGQEVTTVIEPLCTYFESGGALIGFQGCCGQAQTGRLARDVFPIFGNSTGSPVMKEGIPVNEYVRDATIEGFENLPDEFDLLGQFFTYAANISRKLVEVHPAEGQKTVLYREKKTNAPLVVAYENLRGSRSVCFSGCFVRSREDARNYYGKLLDDQIFVRMLGDALSWVMKGSTRFSEFGSNYSELIQAEKDRLAGLLVHAESEAEKRERGKGIMLLASWVMGIAASIGLIYLGFLRTRGKTITEE